VFWRLIPDVDLEPRLRIDADQLVDLAEQAHKFRRESLRMLEEAGAEGLKTETEILEARSELAKADVDLLKARLNQRLAVIRLRQVSGLPVRDYR